MNPGLDNRAHQIRRILILTFLANIAVVTGKVMAGISAHSLSVLADAAHSSVDALNNVMALALSRVAAKAPDADHPYGHRKFETLGALAIVAFLSITVFQLIEQAIKRLASGGVVPEVTPVVIAVMATSAMVSFLVASYEERYGHRLHSEILLADASHTKSDVYASVAVLGGIGVVGLGYPQADAIITLLVALVIARAGWRIIRRAVPILVDERAVAEDAVRMAALGTPGVVDCYAVRSRGHATDVFVELTISVSPTLNVQEGHVIADHVEHRVMADVGAREVIVHVEPAEPREERFVRHG